jgi:hypothetical protein
MIKEEKQSRTEARQDEAQYWSKTGQRRDKGSLAHLVQSVLLPLPCSSLVLLYRLHVLLLLLLVLLLQQVALYL